MKKEELFAEEETVEVVEKKDGALKRAWNWGKNHALEIAVGTGAAILTIAGLKTYSDHQDKIKQKSFDDKLDLAYNVGKLEGKVSAYKDMLDGKDETDN